MERLRKLIKEVLSTPPKKDSCNCGCHTCENVGNPGVLINESLNEKVILSENLQYHVDNKLPLTENTFRYGSEAFLNLWSEARYLYVREAIHVNEDDREILEETNLGEYGIYEGVKVPLDMPMIYENQYEPILEDIQIYGKIYESININNHYKIEGVEKSEGVDMIIFTDKHNIKRALGILGDQIKLYWFDPKKNEWSLGEPLSKYFDEKVINTHGYIIVNHILPQWKNIWFKPINDVRYRMFRGLLYNHLDLDKYDLSYDDDTYQIDITLKDLSLPEAKDKKKNPPLGKPKRGGSKKFYVYVRNPKTKKIKKVSFGDTSGLSVKFKDPKARKAFAARHDCKNKTNKLQPSYWSCRIGRYWKSLGGEKNFSGFW
jgi:hypothetical protein